MDAWNVLHGYVYIYIYMLYILYILHLQSFTYTYSFILYVDIAGLHVDLHKSICMYVNMHYALVYTNLYPICFVLHFIHIYIYILNYISMLSKPACALHTHTRVHVRWCFKQNCYSSPSSWSLLTSAFLSTFFVHPVEAHHAVYLQQQDQGDPLENVDP